MTKEIKVYEPVFFIFFGIFHLHRIWGLIDRENYSKFWIDVMKNKGMFYYFLMGVLTILCVCGIVTFLKNWKNNYWWRWIYLFGGSYLLFDLFAIATGLKFWERLLLKMFDVSAPYWNILWISFVLLGAFSFAYDRPAFRQLIEDIQDGEVSTLITKDLSRLGRNYLETGTYIEVFSPTTMYVTLLSMTAWTP